ncbi:hypothetical protein F5X99DRAFT_213413 [Biscogniauxia marginata]|nr:hypothetical protein F5X99DRAFT_213413 [Biscogniauxia marginata]
MTEEAVDVSMTDTDPPPQKTNKSHELVTRTIRAPPYAYAHLEVFSNEGPDVVELDALQVRSYCTAALRQFLGATGVAIPLDILKVEGHSCWLRLPRDDLGGFSAAITAWQGTTQDGVRLSLRVRGCADWLGLLVGQEGQQRLWSG